MHVPPLRCSFVTWEESIAAFATKRCPFMDWNPTQESGVGGLPWAPSERIHQTEVIARQGPLNEWKCTTL